MNSRRLKRVTVSGVVILDWLTHPNKSGVDVVKGLPKGVKFEFFGWPHDGQVDLILSSETWEEVPINDIIPEFRLVYRKVE